jgi:dihydroorotase
MVRWVIPSARTRIFAFLNVAATGLAHTPEIRTLNDIEPDRAIELALRHPEIIRGIKFRTVGEGAALSKLTVFHSAMAIARNSGIPLMMHVGDRTLSHTSDLVRQMVQQLEPGDAITHLYSPEHASLSPDDDLMMREVQEGMARGVVLDASPGTAGFSVERARRLIDRGITPSTIGSDLTLRSHQQQVFSLHEVLGMYLALGFSLRDVVAMSTINAAKFLGQAHALGSLQPGRPADVSLLRVVRNSWTFRDSLGHTLVGDTALEPVACLSAGEFITAEWGPHPWGWLPAPTDERAKA